MSTGLQLDVATPERVSMSLPVAGIGYRSLAYLVDLALILAFWLILYFLYALTGPDVIKVLGGMSSVVRVAALVAVFFFQWVYWTAAEVLWRGQTPGKRLMKIRIVRLDGSPVGVFESAVRNLLRFVDFLPGFYALAIVVMLFDSKHRRLGDLAAGTVALREEQIDLDRYAPKPALAAPLPSGRALTPHEHELVRSLAERFDALEPQARLRLGRQMAERFGDDPSALASDADVRTWLAARST